MRNVVAYSLCVSLFFLAQSISAQTSTCEFLLKRNFKKLEKDLSDLNAKKERGDKEYQLKSEADLFGAALADKKQKLDDCKSNTGKSLTELENTYSTIKQGYDAFLSSALTVSGQPDYGEKNYLLTKLEIFLVQFGDSAMKDKDKTLVRSDILFLFEYEEEDSVYYRNNIERGLDHIESLQGKLDNPDWIASAYRVVDHIANSGDDQWVNKKIGGLVADLTYMRDVVLPDNKNLNALLKHAKSKKR